MALYSQMLFHLLLTDYSADHGIYLQLCSLDTASWLSSELSSSNAPAEYWTRKLQSFCHSCSLFKMAFCECNFPIFIHFRLACSCISEDCTRLFLLQFWHRVVSPPILFWADCWRTPPKRSRLTRVSLRYILRHASRIRNGFKSFVWLHLLLLFTQWRVYVFFTLHLQLFMYGGRDFPATFPSRYAHTRLSFASAPLLLHAVYCVCVTVSKKWMKVWCNVSLIPSKTIRRDYARCVTFL